MTQTQTFDHLPFVATRIVQYGWCWFISFDGFSWQQQYSTGVCPAFLEDGRARMCREIAPLRLDIDFAFIDHSMMMFRIEDDALMVWMKYAK